MSSSYLWLHTSETEAHLCPQTTPASVQVSQEWGEELQQWRLGRAGASEPVTTHCDVPEGTIRAEDNGWKIKPIFLCRAWTLQGTR